VQKQYELLWRTRITKIMQRIHSSAAAQGMQATRSIPGTGMPTAAVPDNPHMNPHHSPYSHMPAGGHSPVSVPAYPQAYDGGAHGAAGPYSHHSMMRAHGSMAGGHGHGMAGSSEPAAYNSGMLYHNEHRSSLCAPTPLCRFLCGCCGPGQLHRVCASPQH
jgi:hypothetical protein